MSTEGSALAEGVKRMQANDLQGARAVFQSMIQANPSDGKAFGYLGIVKARMGDSRGGILDLQQAVRLQPYDAGALYNLAVALAQVNRTADAREALQQALKLEPGNTRARAALDKLGQTAVVAQQPAYVPQPAAPAYASGPQPLTGGMPLASPQPLTGPQPLAGGMPLTAPQPLTGPQPLGAAMPLTGEAVAPANYSAPPTSYGTPPSPYGAPPSPYGASGGQTYGGQAPAYGGAPSIYGGPGAASMYSPAAMKAYNAPSAGTRILRGIGWGALMGQIWTVYIAIGVLVFGGLAAAASGPGAGIVGLSMIVVVVLAAVGNAFMFAVAGFIIGAANMDDDGGAIVGIIVSLLIVGGQFLIGMRGIAGLIIGVFIAISFGRQIGGQIANKCQA